MLDLTTDFYLSSLSSSDHYEYVTLERGRTRTHLHNINITTIRRIIEPIYPYLHNCVIARREAFAQNATLSAVAASGDIVGRVDAARSLRGRTRASEPDEEGGEGGGKEIVINTAAVLCGPRSCGTGRVLVVTAGGRVRRRRGRCGRKQTFLESRYPVSRLSRYWFDTYQL